LCLPSCVQGALSEFLFVRLDGRDEEEPKSSPVHLSIRKGKEVRDKERMKNGKEEKLKEGRNFVNFFCTICLSFVFLIYPFMLASAACKWTNEMNELGN